MENNNFQKLFMEYEEDSHAVLNFWVLKGRNP